MDTVGGHGAGPSDVRVRPGMGTGPAKHVVVLVNSLATTTGMWDAVVDHLPSAWTVVRFDQRDRGTHAGRGFDLDDLVDDVFRVLDDCQVQQACVAGVSLGGLVALRAARLRPERVGSVAAMCCAARFPRQSWLERGETVRRAGVASITDMVMDRWFTPGFQQAAPDVLADYRRMFASTDTDGYAFACDLLAAADVRADLEHIRAPTLVLSGEDDRANPVADQELIAASVPGSRHEVLRATAHLAPATAPAEVARLLTEHVVAGG